MLSHPSRFKDIQELKLPVTLEKFSISKTLGQGSFGTVVLRVLKKSMQVMALKVMDASTLNEKMVTRLAEEIEIQHKLRHQRILRIQGYFVSAENGILVLQYAPNGNLYQYLIDRPRLEENVARRFVRQTAEALFFCHQQGVIHRCVKPENMLIDSKWNILLPDFGWSVQTEHGELTETFCGTPDYLSPELLMNSPHDFQVDSWSTGVLVFELLTGSTPFTSKKKVLPWNKKAKLITKCKDTTPLYVPRKTKNLIDGILVLDPRKRMAMSEILAHDWLARNDVNVVVQDFNPSEKAGSSKRGQTDVQKTEEKSVVDSTAPVEMEGTTPGGEVVIGGTDSLKKERKDMDRSGRKKETVKEETSPVIVLEFIPPACVARSKRGQTDVQKKKEETVIDSTVAVEMKGGTPDGEVVIDGTGFPKKKNEHNIIKRMWNAVSRKWIKVVDVE